MNIEQREHLEKHCRTLLALYKATNNFAYLQQLKKLKKQIAELILKKAA